MKQTEDLQLARVADEVFEEIILPQAEHPEEVHYFLDLLKSIVDPVQDPEFPWGSAILEYEEEEEDE